MLYFFLIKYNFVNTLPIFLNEFNIDILISKFIHWKIDFKKDPEILVEEFSSLFC